eukprot:COSAG05_NODE_8146_length_732_cov_0.562401_1_plen_35_part_10
MALVAPIRTGGEHGVGSVTSRLRSSIISRCTLSRL